MRAHARNWLEAVWLHACAALAEEAAAAQKEAARLRAELALARAVSLADSAEATPSGGRLLVARLDGADGKALQARTLNDAPFFLQGFFIICPHPAEGERCSLAEGGT
jgi:hypothetical protein